MLLGFCWRTKNSAPFRVLRVWKCLEELFSHLLKDLQALLLSAAHFRSPHSRSCTSPCSYHRLLSHHPLHFSCMNFVQYIHSSPMSKPRQPCLSSKPFNFNYPSLILFLIILVFDQGKNLIFFFLIQPSQLGVGLALGVCWLMTHDSCWQVTYQNQDARKRSGHDWPWPNIISAASMPSLRSGKPLYA